MKGETMKDTVSSLFSKVYQGKRLLAVQLNGFNHTIFYDTGNSDSKIMIERYSAYTDMGFKKAKEFFNTLSEFETVYHEAYKRNPLEIVYVHPSERETLDYAI
jgi:hypothetical protein